ncbi:MAG TPA: hypothetical protein DCY72_02190 [Ruminococcaceae bacterium]|nr:hypothetical protein [Oscillospiraceae bacterium]
MIDQREKQSFFIFQSSIFSLKYHNIPPWGIFVLIIYPIGVFVNRFILPAYLTFALKYRIIYPVIL